MHSVGYIFPFLLCLSLLLFSQLFLTNRFKGLDLVDRVPEKLWMEVPNIVREVVTRTIPKKKKRRKANWLSEEALQIADERRKSKAREKGKDIPN